MAGAIWDSGIHRWTQLTVEECQHPREGMGIPDREICRAKEHWSEITYEATPLKIGNTSVLCKPLTNWFDSAGLPILARKQWVLRCKQFPMESQRAAPEPAGAPRFPICLRA